MPAPVTAWCGGCASHHAVDAHWRAIWVDAESALRLTPPLKDGVEEYSQAGYVLVCGQGSALKVLERFLSTLTLDSTLNMHPFQSAFD